jgi:uncharacterized membrane protein YdfJ with MMPL/SSD domain
MNVAARMGGWSTRHRKTAIYGWLLFVVLAVVIGSAAGTKKISDAENTNGDSAKAAVALTSSGLAEPASENVLVQTRNGQPDDATLRTAVSQVVAGLSATGIVTDLHSPLDKDSAAGFVSKDGHSMLVQFDVTGDADTAENRIQPALDAVAAVQRSHAALRIEEYGDASSSKALDKTLGNDFKRAEMLSIPLTLGILLAVFGALVAAIVPLGLALTAFMAAGGLLAFTSRLVHVDSTANSVMLLIGLAVGVDYTLFYLKREREERGRGLSAPDALKIAAATSGRSVLVSGLTVVVALSGLFLTGQAVFEGIAEATVLVVGVAVLGSLTVLPALLSWLGDRIEKGRVPLLRRIGGSNSTGENRAWNALLRRVLRRPGWSALVAGGALVALALPVIGMKTALPGNSDLPAKLPIVQTYDRLAAAFPGGPVAAEIVVTAPDVRSGAVTTALKELSARAVATGEMSAPLSARTSADGTVTEIALPLAGDGDDAASNHALTLLRTQVVPETVGAVPGAHAYVTGETAGSRDFGHQLRSRAPLVFAFVLALAFLLLLTAFRSLTIAVTAIGLNLLSIGAAYGAMVLVFQHHWLDGVLHYHSTGSIATWIPLFMFAILFGLSMDYHVFILSRIAENRRNGMSTKPAIERGISSTAGVVTSAAVIMVAVFSIFATLSQVQMKQVGVGLAVAVLLDATVVRAVLLPSVMSLLGERNWYLPKWLQWLPREKQSEGSAISLQPEAREFLSELSR